MRNMFKGYHGIMLYKERTEEQEFGRPKQNFRLCPDCLAIYYNKFWHHLGNHTKLQTKLMEGKVLEFKKCPACLMINDNQYEGRLIIEKIPRQFENELFNLIRSFGRKAYERDCQHRLIAVQRNGQGRLIITATENQLANKLARKIQDVFSRVEIKVSYSKEPNDVERAVVSFNPLILLKAAPS